MTVNTYFCRKDPPELHPLRYGGHRTSSEPFLGLGSSAIPLILIEKAKLRHTTNDNFMALCASYSRMHATVVIFQLPHSTLSPSSAATSAPRSVFIAMHSVLSRCGQHIKLELLSSSLLSTFSPSSRPGAPPTIREQKYASPDGLN